MTEEEIQRFKEYTRRILAADGIVAVLNRDELEDMMALLKKHQQESQ